MKYLCLLPLLLFIQLVKAQDEPIRVLFLGNSYTAYNNLPQLIDDCAASAGFDMETGANTPGGTTFLAHSQNTTSLSLIQQGNWDFVVLQEQSQIPSFPISQVESECFPFAAALNEEILEFNECAETVFYMTWGRENGDAQNCPNWPPVCTYEGMDDLLSERYMTMAADNEAIVSPVGELWRVIRTNHPEIDLYDSDGSHPSAVGSYAAAVAFFTTIFRADPTTITFNFNLSADITTIIKEEAQALIYEQQAQWFIGTYDDPNGPCAVVSVPNEHSVQTEQVFGFISNDQLIISNTEKIAALEVYDVAGKLMIQRTNDFTNITLPSGSGVYLLHFTTIQGDRVIQKMVKQ
jgi:hypothetical protein